MPHKSYFVSDLHLFCRRFDGERYWERSLELAGQAKAFVLGGDIFDFRWTTMATIEQTADEAIRMLKTLVASNRNCQFHLLSGNHDYHNTFLMRLEPVAQCEPNLSWHPYFVRLGSSLFLHGDVAARQRIGRSLGRNRERWLQARKQGQFPNLLYDVLVHTRCHMLAYQVVYPRRAVAKRILAYLERIGHGPSTGIEDVYFGHTHLSMTGFTSGGVRLHNCGAPVKGCVFHILEDVV